MIREKAREGYLLVYKTDEYITVTPAVSAPDGTDLSCWEELPEKEARELEQTFNLDNNK